MATAEEAAAAEAARAEAAAAAAEEERKAAEAVAEAEAEAAAEVAGARGAGADGTVIARTVVNALQGLVNGANQFLDMHEQRLMAADAEVAEADRAFHDLNAMVTASMEKLRQETDGEERSRLVQEIGLLQTQLGIFNGRFIALKQQRSDGFDRMAEARVKLIDAVARVVNADAAQQEAALNAHHVASKEFELRSAEIAGIMATHVQMILGIWLVLMIAKYHKYALGDSQMEGWLTMVVGGFSAWVVGGSVVMQAVGVAAGVAATLRKAHSLVLLVFLVVFHLAITTVAGYKRKYLDGLTLLCMVVAMYVLVFERFIMPLLASRAWQHTSLAIFKYLGVLPLAGTICGAVFFWYHSSGGKCMLPLPGANTVFAVSNCQPGFEIMPGQSCEVGCKPGFSNHAKTNACGGYLWFTGYCAVTTFYCTADLTGAHFRSEADLECMPEGDDPSHPDNLAKL